MTVPHPMQTILQDLLMKEESEHFVVHYGLRNPRTGPRFWPGGVRDLRLVRTYVSGLERLYRTMTTAPWSRQPPNTAGSGRTHVFIFKISDFLHLHDSPFTTADEKGIPFIGLPHRNYEVSTRGSWELAESTAVHEAAHVFNFAKRPHPDPYSKKWEWYDEGLAVYMERIVPGGNRDHFRFLSDWCDMPEIPLDSDESIHCYRTCMFIRFLAERFGNALANSVWTEAEETESPIQTMARLLAARKNTFASPDPNTRDVFASAYCMDSYFLLDSHSSLFAPDIYDRYGDRAVTESFELRSGSRAEAKGVLDHLACCYYRLYRANGIPGLRVRLVTDGPIKAEVASVGHDMHKGEVWPLNSAVLDNGAKAREREITGIEPDSLDHLVLVVSNCGLRSAAEDQNEHDDQKGYTIRIEALE